MKLPPWRYRGARALVTGASAGIGEEFARQLAERGMDLVLNARREERLAQLAEEISSRHGVRVEIAAADLSDPAAPARVWARASGSRPVDLLVNNAGFGAHGRFDAVPLERQLEMVRLNCSALLELTHRALEEMRPRQCGAVVNVASVAAFQPVPDLATYAATKAFVLSLSEALWAESRDAGVRVLALCPGRTPTEFQEVAGTGSAVGAFGERSAAEVVAAGLDALEHGKSYVVPGLENYLATWPGRVLPHSVVTRTLRRAARRVWERAAAR